jgi:hypothetical protein
MFPRPPPARRHHHDDACGKMVPIMPEVHQADM